MIHNRFRLLLSVDCPQTLWLTQLRHEDLKPQNVLVHGTNILLTDFGFR